MHLELARPALCLCSICPPLCFPSPRSGGLKKEKKNRKSIACSCSCSPSNCGFCAPETFLGEESHRGAKTLLGSVIPCRISGSLISCLDREHFSLAPTLPCSLTSSFRGDPQTRLHTRERFLSKRLEYVNGLPFLISGFLATAMPTVLN